MLNRIWCAMVLISLAAAAFTGRMEETAAAMGKGAQAAISLSAATAGTLCAWTGLMELAGQSGLVKRAARLFRPVICRLFPEYAENETVQNKISMNLAANLLGLGNAATPLGMDAMQEMARLHPGDTPSRGAMLFVVLNTASMQLIPTYAVTLRTRYGSAAPYDILPCVWLVSLVSLTVCVAAARMLGRHG